MFSKFHLITDKIEGGKGANALICVRSQLKPHYSVLRQETLLHIVSHHSDMVLWWTNILSSVVGLSALYVFKLYLKVTYSKSFFKPLGGLISFKHIWWGAY